MISDAQALVNVTSWLEAFKDKYTQVDILSFMSLRLRLVKSVLSYSGYKRENCRFLDEFPQTFKHFYGNWSINQYSFCIFNYHLGVSWTIIPSTTNCIKWSCNGFLFGYLEGMNWRKHERFSSPSIWNCHWHCQLQ